MSEDVYPVREDSILLRDAALGSVDGGSVLEVGTGSGFVAEAVDPYASRVVATDVNPHAVRAARRRGVPAVLTNLADGVRGEFDVVLFNPPYLPEDGDEGWMKHALSGGATGREVIEEFLGGVDRVLSEGGVVLLVASTRTWLDVVKELAGRNGFSVEVAARDRFFFEEVVVFRLRRRP